MIGSYNGTVIGQPQGYMPNEQMYGNRSALDFSQPDADLSAYDSQSLNSEQIDSEGNGVRAKGKKQKRKMGMYGFLKILNGLLYLSTLCLAFGYFASTKFVSKFTYYMFLGTLVARPALIGLYSLVMILLELVRKKSAKKVIKKKTK